jgi:acylphosphatase
VTGSGLPARRLEVVIHGRVHGVGFRIHAERAARRHGIVGWVANEPDGTVKAVGEGPDGALREWLSDLRAGPLGGSVSAVDERWSIASGIFDAFEIRSGWHSGD